MKKLLLLVFILYAHCFGFAQSPKKETLSFYKSISKLDTNEIKEGKHLELARTFSIEEFVSYYLEYRIYKNQDGTFYIIPISKDSLNTYFVRKHNSYGVLIFFKVNTKDLNEIHYEGLNGDTLRNKFITEIVPEADKKKVKRKSAVEMAFYNSDFTYSYNPKTKRILVRYKWKLSGDFGIRIINKTYTAEYDIAIKQFINPGIN